MLRCRAGLVSCNAVWMQHFKGLLCLDTVMSCHGFDDSLLSDREVLRRCPPPTPAHTHHTILPRLLRRALVSLCSRTYMHCPAGHCFLLLQLTR